MPLIRRVPKRGFHNLFRVENQIVKLGDLTKIDGDTVSPVTLVAAGLVDKVEKPVKLLRGGEVSRAFAVEGCAASKGAREEIEKAGGRFES